MFTAAVQRRRTFSRCLLRPELRRGWRAGWRILIISSPRQDLYFGGDAAAEAGRGGAAGRRQEEAGDGAGRRDGAAEEVVGRAGRQEGREVAATVLQAAVRTVICIRRPWRLRRVTVAVHARWRMVTARRDYRQVEACQASVRCWLARSSRHGCPGQAGPAGEGGEGRGSGPYYSCTDLSLKYIILEKTASCDCFFWIFDPLGPLGRANWVKTKYLLRNLNVYEYYLK
jgi:hypothetical protein